MSFSIDWTTIGLRGNPFAMSPPEDPQSAVWADHQRLKEQFDHVFREAQGSAPTQVVLCRGPIGGGKTHASLYFSLKDRWPDQQPQVRDVLVLRVPTPKETGKPDRDFYIDILEILDFDEIHEAVHQAIAEVGLDEARRKLRQTVISSDLVNAILRLGDEDEDDWILLKAYFLDKCTKPELRKLGLSRNIEKTQDYFRVLSGLLQCYTGFAEPERLAEHTRVCLWLDEMEDFVYFSPSQYRPFGQGLRELVDRVPSYLSLFLNFTLTSPEEYEEIELILGAALIDRVTDSIFFDEMEHSEMLRYVADLLSSFRIKKHPSNNPYYPFDDNAMQLILSDLPTRTPRDINKRCRKILIKAFQEGLLDPGDSPTINLEYVRRVDMEEIDREVG